MKAISALGMLRKEENDQGWYQGIRQVQDLMNHFILQLYVQLPTFVGATQDHRIAAQANYDH